MCDSRFKYLDSDALQAQMILLPYISGSSAAAEMLILLPRTEHNCKTQSWLSQISWDNIKAEVRKMKSNLASNVLVAYLSHGTDRMLDRNA